MVAQGTVLGLLGSSGESSGPHLHYQLTSAPSVFDADGLPCAFANIGATPPGNGVVLTRGTFFDVK